MVARTAGGLSRSRLRLVLGLFFLALAIPAAVLVLHAYDQLKWEAFHQARMQAEELASRIDQRIAELVDREEQRGFGDYQFLVVRGSAETNFLQPSPLAEFPPGQDLPGLLGHFQVDADGNFSTPLLPRREDVTASYGITAGERIDRAKAETRILAVLADNRLVDARSARRAPPAGVDRKLPQPPADTRANDSISAGSASTMPAAPSEAGPGRKRKQELESRERAAQSAFDELKKSTPALKNTLRSRPSADSSRTSAESDTDYPGFSANDLDTGAQRGARLKRETRVTRKEISQLALPGTVEEAAVGKLDDVSAPRITTFESELDPFELSLLDDGHLVLFRKVWREGRRYVQGALLEQRPFLDALVGTAFDASNVSTFSQLTAHWGDRPAVSYPGHSERGPITRSSTEALDGTALYRTRMSAPVSELELVFGATQIPAGPGARVVVWVAAVLAAVLAGGVALMYRLGSREIDLANQQQDFVAAVSHELRTPLTSIRMYGEMLREGWASEEKKRGYYDFICQESERLSRLIGNVLQLARMTRNEGPVELKDVSVGELMDGIRSKVASAVAQAGFELRCDASRDLAGRALRVDPDGFSQIFINLVDNAIKFSARAAIRRVEIHAVEDASRQQLTISVRDHGPGIPREQMKKIFTLFYRSENELTRETVGTGIGLALVRQLARSMHATVEVRNAAPGAEFAVVFPLSTP